jgi:hypothetical protein
MRRQGERPTEMGNGMPLAFAFGGERIFARQTLGSVSRCRSWGTRHLHHLTRWGYMRRFQHFRDWSVFDCVAIGVALLICVLGNVLLR